ncbi:hypothetical protein AFLA_012613 [Aspergillus flavus NRRL3357]|nr:hypothetical protein AFLA_012613 [Aspergillus flavus NRRL3357]
MANTDAWVYHFHNRRECSGNLGSLDDRSSESHFYGHPRISYTYNRHHRSLRWNRKTNRDPHPPWRCRRSTAKEEDIEMGEAIEVENDIVMKDVR